MTTPPTMDPRTYLFVPGNRPERFAKALASSADAIVIDLEDAVAADAKAAARDAIGSWLAARTHDERSRIAVRINDAASPHFADDLALLKRTNPALVMLAKSEGTPGIEAVCDASSDVSVLALVESARGVESVDAIARAPGVARLIFGTLDLALDLGLDITDLLDPLAYAAARLVLASRLAGLPSPVAGVTPQIGDAARLASDLAWERRHGFPAKLCIHPGQVDAIHAAMRPSDDELAWARRVIEADASSPGAAQLDGRMIDRPVVLRAERALAQAGVR